MRKSITINKIAVWLITLMMTVYLLPSYTVCAEASTGDFKITATDGVTSLTEGTDYSFDGNKLTISTQTPVTVEMADGITETANTIAADTSNGSVNILLKDINIATLQRNAVEISGDNDAVFDVTGTNTVSAYNSGFEAKGTGLKFKSENEGTLNFTGSSYAIYSSSSSAEKPLEFEGNIHVKITGCTSHGIYYQAGSVSFDGAPVVNIDAVEGKYAIYGKGINFSGGCVTINYAEDGGSSYAIACSENSNDITINGTADIHIKNARRGINSNGGKVIITDNAKVRMYDGDSENRSGGITQDDVITTGAFKVPYAELQVSGNAVVDVLTAGNGINSGKTTISDDAKVEITVNNESNYGKNGLRLYDNLDVRNNGVLKINVTQGDATGIFGNSSTTVNLSDSAKVMLTNTQQGAYVGPISLSGNAAMVIKDAKNKAAANETLSIADSATFEASLIATSEPKKNDTLIGKYTVIPASGKAYMVKAGDTFDTAESNYYTSETTKSSSKAWRYFYAEPATNIPVTITAKNEEIIYGDDTYDVAQLFDIDTNAGAPTYSIVDETGTDAGSGILSGAVLTITKTGEIKIKVETAANGIYLPSEATAVLKVLPKTITAVIDLTAPVKNAAPQTSIEADEYTATVEWSPEIPTGGTFAKNTTYTATITITPKQNYTVDGIDENGYTVSGATTVTSALDSNIVTAVFPKTAGSSGGIVGTTHYTVSFETNSGSKISSQRVTRNAVIKEPTNPTRDGFDFDGWYTDKELKTKYDFSSKVTKSITLYAAWTEKKSETADPTDKPSIPEEKDKFTDVDDNDWFSENVKYVFENGLMSGVSESKFAPNDNLTRAMLVTILYRAEGKPEVNKSIPFADVLADSYYADAVTWAQQNGIVMGVSENEFAPDIDITREQIAAIMFRYAKEKGYDVSVGEDTNILSYTDAEDISEYAIEPMQYAVGSGLIKGKSESTLNPKDTATRAEIAAILQRFIEKNK